ncbi:9687_t:CDS:10 [Diversispora eburnea]|uniref:9687_t:CDS:1 n=1 Tax=Diversispora eburnea TaxID=1213867 RepID=A0A9N8WML3_9GLOM|nr:9687_t:CDS:10 [Diversispora eburnea]
MSFTTNNIGLTNLNNNLKNNKITGGDIEYERISRALNSLVKYFLHEVSPFEPNKPINKETVGGGKTNNTELLTTRQQHTFDYLIREHKSSSKALRFANLFTKLQSQSIVTRKWSVLYFLLSVSDQSNSNEMTGILYTAPIEQTFSFRGLQNIQNISSITPSPPRSTLRIQKEDPLPIKTGFPKPDLDNNLNNKYNSEKLLLRDIIFIFQGINGQYIKWDSEAKSFIIDLKISINRSTVDLLHRLSELGFLYRRVEEFVKMNANDPFIGLVGQAFCSVLQHELTEYYRFIANLEATITKEVDNQQFLTNGISLKRLLVWTQDSLFKLRIMSVLVDCCKEKRGGALVSTIYNYTNHGDPFIQEFINKMLEEISRPFFEMLQRWIYEGELDDPFEEFFVSCDPNVQEEDLWRSKYSILKDMQPTFISELLAKKVSLKYGDMVALESSIDATYTATSQRLLNILFTKYKLKEHFIALKRYLLLGQGDFIQHLMAQLGPGLGKPATTIYHHNLTGILEAAIRASNAQYDDPDILRRLDAGLLEVSSGDVGWDVFSLFYRVDSPLNTIFTPQAMHQYLKIFNLLWRLKRVEHDLSFCWRRNMTSARSFLRVEELRKEINTSRLVCSEMIHFVYQLQYYILFEVIECSWDELVTDIHNPSGDLDSLIEAHNKYLSNVSNKSFLNASNNQDLFFNTKIDELHNLGVKETIRRDNNSGSRKDQNHSRSNDKSEDPKAIQECLNEVAGQFKSEVVNLLTALAHHQDTDLRFLSVSLDFNEFYHVNEKYPGSRKRTLGS